MDNISEVMNKIKNKFKEQIPKDLKTFKKKAEGIFAFNSPVYTKKTQKGWTSQFKKTSKNFKITFGNRVPQALYSEYGTISNFSNNVLKIDNITLTSKTSKLKDKRKYNGKSAFENIKDWCVYKGILDSKTQYAIFKIIMKYGRKKNPPTFGMITAIPGVWALYKKTIMDSIKHVA